MKHYTWDELNDFTRDALRRMCVQYGIKGMSKKRKDECIQALLQNFPMPVATKKIKTHIAFCIDESGSVRSIIKPLIEAFNNNLAKMRDSVMREGQEAYISVLAFGSNTQYHRVIYTGVNIENARNLTMSDLNPTGMTPLFDSVYRAIETLNRFDDGDQTTSFIISAVTDGQENSSRHPGSTQTIKLINQMISTDRWTFTFLIPHNHISQFKSMYKGIPAGNIQGWDERTEQGTVAAFQVTSNAYDQFFGSRSRGLTASTTFYSDLSGVSAQKAKKQLADISKDVQFYNLNKTMEIKTMVESITMRPYVKGTAFYQLVKTEKKVQPYKLIAIRHRSNGKVYAGSAARTMLGIDVNHTIRLAPGDHGEWDIFIQSTSMNRKIMPGTNIMVWDDAIYYKN